MTKLILRSSKSSLVLPSDGTLETVLTDDSWRSDLENGDSLSFESSEEEQESPFVEDDAETNTFAGSLLVPNVSKGRYSIPLQSKSRKWLKYLILIPLSTLTSAAFMAYFWVPLLLHKGFFTFLDNFLWDTVAKNKLAMAVLLIPVVAGIVWDIATDIWSFVMLCRGRQRRKLPCNIPRLVHAVIVCNYKEPLDVLKATVKSIAGNTLSSSTIVILACEERDGQANDTFAALKAEFSSDFRAFFKTSHRLAPGEVIGKSSNENHACKELYKFVLREGMDPFQVMVTTCDADSLFDHVFLEQVEAEFCRMPDGRRFIYNSPINTYRNLPECDPIVRGIEILRCQFDTFTGLDFRPAQSNYSLTLGFANEINFWDPSNTSEDFHTTLKAMAMTGKGTNIVVRVWSLILNDSVCGFKDRWVQAKRHCWGIEETAFVASLFPIVRMRQWLELFGRVTSQMFGVCVPTFITIFFAPTREMLASLRWETRALLLAIFVASVTYDWMKTILREVFLYKYIIGDRYLMMKRTNLEWIQLVLFWPILSSTSKFIFASLATWRVLVHAVFHDTLVYVTAPKALSIASSTTSIDSIISKISSTSIPSTIETKPKKSM